ncbi:MAG TPA: PAS domain S-box protein, partial [Pirellulales bacterium]|nr:PAS domain S-box protein [Pirellulales bacterium]
DAAIELAGADFGAIQLLDPTTGALCIAAQRGLPDWWLESWNAAPQSHDSCAVALERGERIVVEDNQHSPILAGTPALELQLRAGIRAAQSTPIVTRSDMALGVFSTYYRQPYRPDQGALRLLDLLARQASDMIFRAQSEAALRESEQRLRLAVNAAKLGAWDWNLSTDALTWSPRQFELFGIRPEDFSGTGEAALAAVHPEDRPLLEEAIRRARYEREAFYATFRVVDADGGERWLVGMGRKLRQHDGCEERMIGVNLDITNEKQAEELLQQANKDLEGQVAARTAELRDQSSRLRAILETALTAIFTADQTGAIRSANSAADRIFGYSAGELVGRNIKALMPQDYREDDEGLSSSFGHIIGTTREVMGRRKDGSHFPALLAVNEIPELKLYAGILLDITRQKELEREVLEIATLEDQRIGQDLHDDIGQELSALGLLAGGLTEAVREKMPDHAALAERIERKTREVLRKVRTMAGGLAVADLAADGLPAALAELASRLNEVSQMRFVFRTDRQTPLRNAFWATHLYHIAQEACTNALKHSAAGSVEIWLRSLDGDLILEVQDDGRGMPPAATEGLGRQIMRNRAKLLGARLAIESRKPHGTLVQCVLKLQRSST